MPNNLSMGQIISNTKSKEHVFHISSTYPNHNRLTFKNRTDRFDPWEKMRYIVPPQSYGLVAQLVEHTADNGEVTSSSLVGPIDFGLHPLIFRCKTLQAIAKHQTKRIVHYGRFFFFASFHRYNKGHYELEREDKPT